MSQENVETVRKVIEARARGSRPPDVEIDWLRSASDPEGYRDLLAPDVEIDMTRRVFNPEVYRGLEGFARLQDELREVWKEWRMTPERFLDVGDRVVLIEHIRGRARGSGVELDIPSASIWTLLDGRVTRVEGGLDPDEALKAVGLGTDAEEPTKPDVVELTRRAIEAAGRRDFDAAMSCYAEDSVLDGSAMGILAYEGVDTIRREMEAWTVAFEEFEIEIEEIRDMGNGVVLSRTRQSGRPPGVSGHVEMPIIGVTQWSAGKIAHMIFFRDTDEARAAAERLAQGQR